MYKKRVHRNKEKAFHIGIPLFKLVFLVLLVCGLFLTVWQQPRVHPPDSGSRWISDPRYISNVDVNWDDVMKVIHKLNDYQAIGLLNFNDTEIIYWKHLVPDVTQHVLQLHPVGKNVTWESLYPEWIDEQKLKEIPICPSLLKSRVPNTRLDLLAVKLPSTNGSNWSRDVPRLHLQLAAANIAASSEGVHLLFVTERFPVPNLFPCKELVARHGNVWLFKPDLNVLRHKLQLPVGSCELALPLGDTVPLYTGNPRREAYATILHSAHVYVCGAIAAAQSIRLSGSTRDLIILVDESISAYHRSGLEAAGWKIRTIQRIRNPKAEKDAYNEWNYSKFRLWQLTDYDKIIFIDADLLILRNIDFLFGMPEISATGNNATLFNSGVMVIEPSNCTFELLMEHINEIESYNGGDQGYLNEVFTWWHRIPKHMNFLKHFWVGDEEEVKQMKIRLFGAEPPVLYVLHYLGIKPWLCFRDYDCNFNSDIFQEFASDTAHKKWWKVHDAMPAELHQFCYLQSKQKAQLEWDRREAEKGKYKDGHWKIRIRDKRLKKCIDKLCNWRSMLRHWGETNWTDVDDFFNQTPPALSTASLPAL